MGAMNESEGPAGFNKSCLIQRLQRPWTKGDVVFPSGFDYIEEMLSDTSPKTLATEVRSKIYELDYMGSSEFEWGIVPQTLKKIAQQAKEYGAFTVKVKFKDMDRPFRYKGGIEDSREFSIYSICRRDHAPFVEARIRELCNEAKYKIHLKENTYLVHALIHSAEVAVPAKPTKSKSKRVKKDEGEFSGYERYQGWLEMENAFFFFIDRRMFEGVARLFKIGMKP